MNQLMRSRKKPCGPALKKERTDGRDGLAEGIATMATKPVLHGDMSLEACAGVTVYCLAAIGAV